MDIAPADLCSLMSIYADEWLSEVASIRAYYATLGQQLPRELTAELDLLEHRLRASPETWVAH